MKKLEGYSFNMIAPSHGPVYNEPEFILDAYRDWISDRVSNLAIIPYISMHGSTERMVDHLLDELVERGVEARKFDLSVTDLGKLAIDLVDAATIVIGSPAVHVGPHPVVVSTAYLTGVLRPKARYAAIIGSYGWGNKIVEHLSNLLSGLKAETLGTVLCKGMPKAPDLAALDALADAIAAKHAAL
jgi:flavorubredoxin